MMKISRKKGLTISPTDAIINITKRERDKIMNHNIYFLFSILSLVLIAPFGAINPLIALAVGIAGIFFFIWYLKEMEEEEKEYKKELDK